MNSCFAWTVFRVTMSFYGVAHDQLPLASSDRSRGGLQSAIRATVSTAFASVEADRQIGVWCIARGSAWTCCNRNVKRSRNRQPK